MISALIAILLFATSAQAEERPEWTKSPQAADSTYKYYVGRASSVAGESTAISQATKDAYEQAHRENFGSEVQISSETYQTNSSSLSVARVSEKSKMARFENFEQVNFHLEDAGSGRFNVWVMYKFPRSSIVAEQRRLRKIVDTSDGAMAFSIQGTAADKAKGILQLSTDPQGAVVYVDGERFGKTPLQLNGQIEEGKHSVRLDHPQYETIEEEFIIGRNQTITINKTLVRSLGVVTITTDIPNASVIINGQPVGITPIKELKVESGVTHKLDITHSETEKYSQEFQVMKDSFRDLTVSLPKKPSYISVSTKPSGAQLKIGSLSLVSPVQRLNIPSGDYAMSIAKEGYVTRTESFVVAGGEAKVLPTFTLVPVSEERKRLQTSPWKAGMTLGVMGKIIENSHTHVTLGVSVEKKFFNLFGIKVGYDGGNGDASEDKKTPSQGPPNSSVELFAEHTVHMMYASLPLYVYGNFYIAPEVGTASSTVVLNTVNFGGSGFSSGTTDREIKIKQKFAGGYIGYEWLASDANYAWILEAGMRRFDNDTPFKGRNATFVKGGFNIHF